MTYVIIENLRGFFNSRPPLVVFMICLAAFAIALITFAYIVKTKDLPNPDITEDWNTFFEKLSHLKFCVSQNSTTHNLSLPLVNVGDLSPGDALHSIGEKIMDNSNNEPLQRSKRSARKFLSGHKDVSRASSKTEPTVLSEETTWIPSTVPVSKVGMINETFHLNIEFAPSPEFLTSNLRSVYLTTDMTGSMLSMKGSHKDQHISLTVAFPIRDIDCEKNKEGVCSLYVINSCVTLTGPASMLPRARHLKKHTCSSDESLSKESRMKHMTASKLSDGSNRKWCSHGTSLTVQYSFDDSLTVLLSPEDQSVINLHLMRTSYFLFVMVVTLFCYAAVKGRPGKVKIVVYTQHDKI